MATSGEGIGIPLSKVSPKFLHANSTSHTWPFSAIAELIDNAYDPDVDASELRIDIIKVNGITCMTFADDGNGCDKDKLLKMLSFGFCEKDEYETSPRKPIGHYGNGFKSGSMRIGQDALVFTRRSNSTSIGFLSQTYLEQSNCETVMVPIVTWDLPSYKKRRSDTSSTNLAVIREYSPFKTDASLLVELKALERLKTGTKIFIFNLKRSKMGSFELDFESDTTDIRNPETTPMDMTTVYRPMQETTPEFRRSLREYCSILFLKPRMKIILRGHKVKTKLISKSLSQTETDTYKPSWLARPLKIVFGFTSSKNASSDNYGLMMYHKNRLIKAYEKVGFQKQRNKKGDGVVGVVQVDFLQPIHNKQDFNKDEKYHAFITAISKKLNDYWNEKKFGGSCAPAGDLPDWWWAQCDKCLKWRRLPDGTGKLPDRWFCHMNPDASHNRCDIEEEPEDEDEALKRPTYQKTYKKQLRERKKMSKMEEQKQQEMKEKKLAERAAALHRKSKHLKHKEERLMQQQNQKKPTELQKSHLKASKKLLVVRLPSDDLLETAENLAGVSPLLTSGKISTVENNAREGKTSGKQTKKYEELMDITLDYDEEGVEPEEDQRDQQINGGIKADITNQVDEGMDETVNDEFPEKEGGDSIREKSDFPDRCVYYKSSEKFSEMSDSNNETSKEEKTNAEGNKQKMWTVSNSLHTKTKEMQISAHKDEESEGESRQRDEELKKMYASKCSDLTKAEQKLKCLQKKVHKLLRILVPDVELGDTKDVEDIVDEMIHVNA